VKLKSFFKKYSILLLIILSLIIFFFASSRISQLFTKNPDDNNISTEPSLVPGPTPSNSPVTPALTPTPRPEPLTATLISAGDCVPHLTFQKSGIIPGVDRYDFTDVFSDLKPFNDNADYSLISFESAATNNRKDYTNYPLFNCPPEIFDAFYLAGFDLVNCSNNHQLDRRLNGMLETRDNIKNAGMEILGIYEGEEPRYLVKDLNGIKVALMAYTYGCNLNEAALTPEQQKNHLALIDEKRMEQEIKEMEANADVSVVAMHWGVEYTQKPTPYQEELAKKMISWGADVILGSHPHVVQPTEIIEFNGEDKYVIYSMGNFISNQRRGASGYPKTHKELCEDSMLVCVEFIKDPESEKTVINSVKHIPTWLWRYPHNNGFKFKVIPVPEIGWYKNGEYPEEVLTEAYESYNRTMKLVSDYKRN
jgi:poly-gamma-glutamate capsule biosynthesis protein CapA/YwtB (metallophosphatase superfamily)